MICVDNLTKHYNGKVPVRNVTFHVDSGEQVGVWGSTGTGKTTLMRILTAYTPPSEGRVTIAGYDVYTHSLEVRKRIGYLPQTVPLYADMKVCEYLHFVAALRRGSNRVGRVKDVIAEVNLIAQTETLIGRLSKDMRQRVGLAQAIVHNPDVLILDEPTYGLEPQQILEIQELIRSLAKDRTLLLSTRTLSEAEQICDRVLMMSNGGIVAEDTPAYLTARLEGGQRVRLQTSSAPADAVDTLRALEGIDNVSKVGADMFDIECAGCIDCRSTLANVVVEQGWGLLELQVVGASLENILWH
jgi:ABC-2 type transport system ATP-binding protein